ncbi:aminoglycoside phosphotransferase family protein, partial [Streptomyces scabiei]|nr:aminoglycoside phosphotransferase family protein [Streptomyces scabiei]
MRSRAEFIAHAYGLGGGAWDMVPVARGALGQVWRLSG